jgi:hypothetical protein
MLSPNYGFVGLSGGTHRNGSNSFPTSIRSSLDDFWLTVNTRDPNEHNETYAMQPLMAVHSMQELGITVLYTAGHHRKLAIIDGKVLWEGSLNILSQNDSCEIVRRSVSKRLARQMIRFIGASRWL